MHVEDPNNPASPDTTPTDVQPGDTGAPPVADGSDDTQPPPAELDAFSKGVEAAREQEALEDGAPTPAAAPAEGQTPAQDPAQAAPGTQPATDPAAPPAGQQPPAQGDQPPPTVEDEVKQLELKGRAEERFKELHSRAVAGTAAQERVSQWEQTVQSTGATPEQFGNTLRYLSDINSGDHKRMGDAYERMLGELQWLGQQLGREAPGFDPLSAHTDLAGRVQSGEITREIALELAGHRQSAQLQNSSQQAQQERYQQEQANNEGLAQVQRLGQVLRASDPAFEQKMAMLAPSISLIQTSLPPSQWAAALQRHYEALPTVAAPPPPAAAPVARSAPNPIRASAAAPLVAQITPENAFDIGVQSARDRGL